MNATEMDELTKPVRPYYRFCAAALPARHRVGWRS